ncbi:copper homeostasis protein CutC [Cohnella lupini]|uniref:PF03932 family protein CutC n=1 Tax=Cohnella lupini TaxID=1294267 RepID=A0A3D9IRZ8_9BACL|nr:copper homeostasis protein CutC [Cohnella lupini]RED63886.1 copper homeostasis protein CutC [Cohnella lupini]
MILEVIATSLQDAVQAEDNGADRLELITSYAEGGLTPNIGLVEQIVRAISIPVHVMVRPHSRTFVYDRYDIDTMTADIKAISSIGAAGVVLGPLTSEGNIDQRSLEALLSFAGTMNVTFHRAFDELEDQVAGLRILQGYSQINRVLTSGGIKSALEAIPEIRRLVEEADGSSLTILAGSGLKVEGILSFIEQTKVKEVHFGSAVRFNGSGLEPIDCLKLRTLAGILHEKV